MARQAMRSGTSTETLRRECSTAAAAVASSGSPTTWALKPSADTSTRSEAPHLSANVLQARARVGRPSFIYNQRPHADLLRQKVLSGNDRGGIAKGKVENQLT
ncbi:unnamed protein product [Prorocentrum cordatum]|uniref:Uncharacterized protein n=1 Tax=Prorocentrum cordatum TaxID=2364126 RepID=A0ABN9U8N2_9DINO|nr:unnamed protein product [Polarella glacialis]